MHAYAYNAQKFSRRTCTCRKTNGAMPRELQISPRHATAARLPTSTICHHFGKSRLVHKHMTSSSIAPAGRVTIPPTKFILGRVRCKRWTQKYRYIAVAAKSDGESPSCVPSNPFPPPFAAHSRTYRQGQHLPTETRLETVCPAVRLMNTPPPGERSPIGKIANQNFCQVFVTRGPIATNPRIQAPHCHCGPIPWDRLVGPAQELLQNIEVRGR